MIDDPFADQDTAADQAAEAVAASGVEPAFGPRSIGVVSPGAGGRAGDKTVLGDLAFRPQNDLGNAARLIARYGLDLLHVKGLGWLAWDGRRWDVETGGSQAVRFAQRTAEMIRDEAEFIQDYSAMKPGPDRAEIILRRRAFATATGNMSKIAGMLLAAAPRLEAEVDALDAQPGRLPVENGTISLLRRRDLAASAGEAGAVEAEEFVAFAPDHDRDDLATLISPVAYDPAAECPRWLAFLEKVQPDPASRDFLQRHAGYCLSGYTSEESLLAFEGKGANGKSLYIDVLERLLGKAAATIDFATLLADDRRGGANASPDLARLRGVRLATAGEPERGAKLAEGRIKSITGGDRIVARKLREDLFEFRPSFKLILSWNTRPRIGGDDGIWRRILVLPWPVQILQRLADGSRNPDWRRKEDLIAEFMDELPGILNWALRGYGLWRLDGLAPPPAVLAAVASYREQSDPVGTFLHEACDTVDPMARAGSTALHLAFQAWADRQGWGGMSQRRFGEAMEERGFRSEKSGTIFRVGVRLLPEWAEGGSERTGDSPPAGAYDDEAGR